MKRTFVTFLLGVVVGGAGVGAIAVTAGDPYTYSTLSPWLCEQDRQRGLLPPDGAETVPDQRDPCFIRYPNYPTWLMPHR
jgi:hypothetical protein